MRKYDTFVRIEYLIGMKRSLLLLWSRTAMKFFFEESMKSSHSSGY